MKNSGIGSDRRKKGFTLMELLIVVAIIAILVAISIPIFTSQLEKAREQTDIANLRAAKGVAVATYLAGDTSIGATAGKTFTANYDAASGKLITGTPTATYGKGTAAKGGCEKYDMGKGATAETYYTEETVATGKYISVTVSDSGDVLLA